MDEQTFIRRSVEVLIGFMKGFAGSGGPPLNGVSQGRIKQGVAAGAINDDSQCRSKGECSA